MRSLWLAMCVAGAVVTPAQGQLRIGLRGGVMSTTNLVEDFIVEPIEVKRDLAGWVGFEVVKPLKHQLQAGVELRVARAALTSNAPSGELRLTQLTTWSPALILRRTFWNGRLGVWGNLGLILYDADDTGSGSLFRLNQPAPARLGGGLEWNTRLSPHLSAGVGIAYDVHRFTTDVLKEQGFRDPRTVHRLAVGVVLKYDTNPGS